MGQKEVKAKKGSGFKLNAKQKKQMADNLIAMSTVAVERAGLASRLGKSYEGDRDLYTALGYKLNLDYNDFDTFYERGDLGARIVSAPVEGAWERLPTLTDPENDESTLPDDFAKFAKEHRVWHYLQRIDKISGIGRYGVLLLGFDDNENLDVECTNAQNLLFLRPVGELNATIDSWVTDPKNPRYGLPEYYKLSLANANRSGDLNPRVHWSRVLHIAEGCKEDNVYGTPRLKRIFNRLQNLELIVGGSAEMFWRGAFPGYAFSLDPEAQVGEQDEDDLQEEIEEYMHGLKRYFRSQGMKVEALTPQVVSPEAHVKTIISLISACEGIPQRILLGSERGELASSQDERAWAKRCERRREQYVEPAIVRPFLDRLVEKGVIELPENYKVIWEPLQMPSEKEVAEVQKLKTETLAKYAATPEIETLMPPELFMQWVMNYDAEEMKQLNEAVEVVFDEKEEEQKALEEEQRRLALPRGGNAGNTGDEEDEVINS